MEIKSRAAEMTANLTRSENAAMAKVTVHHEQGVWDRITGHPGTYTAHDGDGTSGTGSSREEAISNLHENIQLDQVKDSGNK